MKKSYLAIAFLIFLGIFSGNAQQDPQYTQYMYNTVSVNPGYAGSRGHISIAALHRSQWVGLDGAPKTQTFNVHSPIGYRGVGLGLSIVNDEIGPTSETNIDIDFSYTIWTSTEGRLSFGLKASANLLDIKFSELNQYSNRIENDEVIDKETRMDSTTGISLARMTSLKMPLSMPTDEPATPAPT